MVLNIDLEQQKHQLEEIKRMMIDADPSSYSTIWPVDWIHESFRYPWLAFIVAGVLCYTISSLIERIVLFVSKADEGRSPEADVRIVEAFINGIPVVKLFHCLFVYFQESHPEKGQPHISRGLQLIEGLSIVLLSVTLLMLFLWGLLFFVMGFVSLIAALYY